MGNFDWKHLVAVGVGALLGLAGSLSGIDFSKSCPSAPAAVAPAAVK